MALEGGGEPDACVLFFEIAVVSVSDLTYTRRIVTMNTQAALTGIQNENSLSTQLPLNRNAKKAPLPFHYSNHAQEDDPGQRQAELFYLQKQIQAQTPMVIVLVDGEHIEGCIEWYDRRALKVRGRNKILIYKSAIKYMYKLGENAQ
jgi:sRNA-binding regulator protein Hfq